MLPGSTAPLRHASPCHLRLHRLPRTSDEPEWRHDLRAGEPKLARKVVCMHEEDHGLLWKHVEYRDGRSDSRRSRRLALNFVATIANYEYQFCTYFYQDGSIQYETKLTGCLSTNGLSAGEGPEPTHGTLLAPGLNAQARDFEAGKAGACLHAQGCCAVLMLTSLTGWDRCIFIVIVMDGPAGAWLQLACHARRCGQRPHIPMAQDACQTTLVSLLSSCRRGTIPPGAQP